jgi:hypothetical protein
LKKERTFSSIHLKSALKQSTLSNLKTLIVKVPGKIEGIQIYRTPVVVKREEACSPIYQTKNQDNTEKHGVREKQLTVN